MLQYLWEILFGHSESLFIDLNEFTVCERAVRALLECILFQHVFSRLYYTKFRPCCSFQDIDWTC